MRKILQVVMVKKKRQKLEKLESQAQVANQKLLPRNLKEESQSSNLLQVKQQKQKFQKFLKHQWDQNRLGLQELVSQKRLQLLYQRDKKKKQTHCS